MGTDAIFLVDMPAFCSFVWLSLFWWLLLPWAMVPPFRLGLKPFRSAA